ncbi:hypothetical protein DVH24_005873 [Malus domestica]|uniref:Uncharacterized protein n=1 Tax=Malus domestica TaxID=3750 RepID=A0A498IKC6_MALDO|nr:hypothetical protein DVH24_005873 [Malus domestica]
MVSGQLLKKAFNKYHDEDDLLQLGLLFMLHFVILGIDPSVKVNDLYLHLADNLMMFNKYPRESLSFELPRGALLFAPESTNNDGGLLLMVVVITVVMKTRGSGRGECRLALPPFMERLLPSLEPETYRSWEKNSSSIFQIRH